METIRTFLMHMMLVRDVLTLVRKGPTAWTKRGEDFVKSFPYYRQYTKSVFAYAKSIAEGPPEQALATCRNVCKAMDTLYLMSPTMAKKRPTTHERLERIAEQYEQVRILKTLADVVSPRPDGKACSTEISEILSRFGAVGFKSSVRDDLRILRNGFSHKRIRYAAASVQVFDEYGQLEKTFNAEQIKILDKLISDLFDWASSVTFGALWENPTLSLMFVALMLYDPDFTRSLEDKFNTLKIFRPFFFKRLQRKSRQKKDNGIRFIEAYWHAITSSLPKELSTDELKVMLGDVLYQIVLEIRALSRDSERFLSALSRQSRLPGLKILLLEWANAMPVFTIPPLTNEDLEGHSIGQPNIPELLEAIRKVNIVLPGIGDVQKYLCGCQSDYTASDRVGKRVTSPITQSQKTATIIGLLITAVLFSIVTIVNGLGDVSLHANTNSG